MIRICSVHYILYIFVLQKLQLVEDAQYLTEVVEVGIILTYMRL